MLADSCIRSEFDRAWEAGDTTFTVAIDEFNDAHPLGEYDPEDECMSDTESDCSMAYDSSEGMRTFSFNTSLS